MCLNNGTDPLRLRGLMRLFLISAPFSCLPECLSECYGDKTHLWGLVPAWGSPPHTYSSSVIYPWHNIMCILFHSYTQVDIPVPLWGVQLYGDFTIDFGLPSIVIDYINSRGWGNAIKNMPIIGKVRKWNLHNHTTTHVLWDAPRHLINQ